MRTTFGTTLLPWRISCCRWMPPQWLLIICIPQRQWIILAFLLTSVKSIWYGGRGSIVFAPVCASVTPPQPAAVPLHMSLTSLATSPPASPPACWVDTHTPQFSILSNCFFFFFFCQSLPPELSCLSLPCRHEGSPAVSVLQPFTYLGSCLPCCAARPSLWPSPYQSYSSILSSAA